MGSHRALAVALSLGAAGCLTAPNDLCEGPVTITISGSTPTIDWAPECGVSELAVESGSVRDLVWAIRSEDGIRPSVQYGRAPSGAEVAVPLEELVAGQTYTVILYVADGKLLRVAATSDFSLDD